MSELERLAQAMREVGSSEGPYRQAIDSAGRRAGELAAQLPRNSGRAGRAAGSFQTAAAACRSASSHLYSFGSGCRAFADRLAQGGGGPRTAPATSQGAGEPAGDGAGGGDDGAGNTLANHPSNQALVDVLSAKGFRLASIDDFDYSNNPILGYRDSSPPDDIGYAVRTWNDQIAPGIANGATREDFERWDEDHGLEGTQRLAGVYDCFLGGDPIKSGGTWPNGRMDVNGGRHRLEQAKLHGVKYLPYKP